jgi:hypothetical protein
MAPALNNSQLGGGPYGFLPQQQPQQMGGGGGGGGPRSHPMPRAPNPLPHNSNSNNNNRSLNPQQQSFSHHGPIMRMHTSPLPQTHSLGYAEPAMFPLPTTVSSTPQQLHLQPHKPLPPQVQQAQQVLKLD